MKGRTEILAETCIALWMTSQRSPFICQEARVGIEVHSRVRPWRTLCPHVVTTGVRAVGVPQWQENAHRQDISNEEDTAQGDGRSDWTRGDV